MDRERDRDAVEGLIEEHDEQVGKSEPERERPGQDDPASRPVDGQKPISPDEKPPSADAPRSPDPGPFAPHQGK